MDVARHPLGWIRTHPRAADALLALALVAVSVPVSIQTVAEAGQREFDLLGWGLLVATNVPVAWRRSHPVPALWWAIVATVPFWVLDYPDDATGVGLLILVYSLAAHEGRPRSVRHFWAAVAVLWTLLVAGIISSEDSLPWTALPANIIVFGTAWILGDNLRTRRQYLAELEEKATRTEERQAAEAQRAVAEERARIARELHDVVAHSMSVMVVQAGAARRVIDQNPAQAAEALGAIEATGRESLTEMRRVLGVLRGADTSAELAPAPSLDDFDRLVTQCADAGMPVDLTVTGTVRRLSTGLEMNAYRVVQESLTNALKHAGPARATVRLHYGPDDLVVSVADDGRGAAAASPDRGSGQGIVGMRERVEAYGGTLTAGPRVGGGFEVHAIFRIEGAR